MGSTSFNWFQVIQTAFLVAGFMLAALTFRRNTRAQQVSNYMDLVKYNREIWQLSLQDKDLQKVLSPDERIWTVALTFEQKQFLKFLFLHLSCSYHLFQAGSLIAVEGIKDDISEFLRLPMPARFWEENKRYYNADFVAFVEANRGTPSLPQLNRTSPLSPGAAALGPQSSHKS
jgi:hypothetical protein